MVKAFITIKSGSHLLGRLDLVLFDDSVPRTVENFCELLKRRQFGKGYLNSSFHRLIRGFMIQGGDFTKGDGTGGESIYGESFPDENFIHRHDKAGVLSMANSGKDSNSSQFFITFRPTPHLDGKHVVFGFVDMEKSSSILRSLESIKTGTDDRPLVDLTIVDCGLAEEEADIAAVRADQNEISLDDGEDETAEPKEPDKDVVQEEEIPVDHVEDDQEVEPKTKAEALRLRMRKLKMKMNQARQLNKQEVLREGERMGSVEGANKARRRQIVQEKKLKEAEWVSRNAKALEVASDLGIDGKHLVEQAGESLKKAYKKKERTQANEFAIQDYYNSEGQHRNYNRNLKSLRNSATGGIFSTDDAAGDTGGISLMNGPVDESQEREGARHIANELKRRIEKQAKRRREKVDFEETDVSYINKRNKRFNEKISRNFDKHTAEIRQNLERGTAL